MQPTVGRQVHYWVKAPMDEYDKADPHYEPELQELAATIVALDNWGQTVEERDFTTHLHVLLPPMTRLHPASRQLEQLEIDGEDLRFETVSFYVEAEYCSEPELGHWTWPTRV